ncbi:GntR family transcriptional regulator [Phaeobacter inhibens]|uniref:GntR family transcriptional regulator n=1 Tax=Phaeobacter inhibens TaxID=221822 RepID=UPI0021A54626|nr:GntR family transcriptional regulator [Phaeobacter inhibens]UWR40201.1 GntR family transcriptional regulator [Phaeobacter inhibens]
MKLHAIDISKTESAATIIFRTLQKAIITGELSDGTPLRQDEIAKAFRTSRFPVREAITRLEQQGLVTSQRYKGAVVATLSMQDASEIFELRAKLEADIIRAAVANMTQEITDQAHAHLDAFAACDDPMQWGPLNRQFHGTLYSVSGLPYHVEVIESAMDRIDRYLRAQLIMSDGIARSDQEHRDILRACEERDAEKAARLTTAHILAAKTSLEEQLRAQIP